MTLKNVPGIIKCTSYTCISLHVLQCFIIVERYYDCRSNIIVQSGESAPEPLPVVVRRLLTTSGSALLGITSKNINT